MSGKNPVMTIALTSTFSNLFDPARLFGPIFEKELRVSSRRKRNYIMRFAYLVFLTAFLSVIWLDALDFSVSSGTHVASRLAQAGKQIIVTLVWFQFYAIQLVAVVMLSTAISDEIYHRTLGVLMSTPITGFQIVMGKLSSKLLQLILLLGVSLPVLAVVRIFGGVPWDYIISSLYMTLTTLIFVGSLSLLFSSFSRKTYVVIIVTVLALGFLFGPPFMLMRSISLRMLSKDISMVALYHANPYIMLIMNTSIMLDPSLAGRIRFSWPIHCSIMLTASAFVLFVCVCRVRKVALAQASGRLDMIARLRRLKVVKPAKKTDVTPSDARIRRVIGPPVVWKELISRISSREKLIVMVIIGLEVAMIFALYLFPVVANTLGDRQTHIIYIWIFMGLWIFSATVFPSTCITSEKESRTWPLLLTTTLNDWQILFGKFMGVLRRSIFIWLLLFFYAGLFCAFQYVGPLSLVHIVLIIAGTVVFLSGTGFYFSSRLKHTNEAVITNIALAASIWGLLPFLLALLAQADRSMRELREYYLDLVPFVQAMVVMVPSNFNSIWSSYDWPDHNRGPLESTYLILTVMLGYMFIGMLFAWCAKRRFRRDIF
jgi:ABC-type transport system involved in multi-copper enzyme maturation permease subunit